MRIRVWESPRSTPEHPLFLWQVWREGQLIGRGFSDSYEKAAELAELVFAVHEEQRAKRWWYMPVGPDGYEGIGAFGSLDITLDEDRAGSLALAREKLANLKE